MSFSNISLKMKEKNTKKTSSFCEKGTKSLFFEINISNWKDYLSYKLQQFWNVLEPFYFELPQL